MDIRELTRQLHDARAIAVVQVSGSRTNQTRRYVALMVSGSRIQNITQQLAEACKLRYNYGYDALEAQRTVDEENNRQRISRDCCDLEDAIRSQLHEDVRVDCL